MVNIKLIIPQDWTSDQKGMFFEKEIGKLLKKMRFEITERIRFTGMEIDVLAENKDTQQKAFVECKFVSEPISSGVITDLIGKSVVKNIKMIYLFSTSDLGKEAKGLYDGIQSDLEKNYLFSFIGSDKLGEMYLDLLGLKSIEEIIKESSINEKNIGSVTLVISPVQDFWVVEYKLQGIPDKLLIFPIKEKNSVDKIQIRKILDENKIWLGLDCEDGNNLIDRGEDSAYDNSQKEILETISSIPVADQFDDYRPCRPMDFIGRGALQKEIWDFLNNVLNHKTTTRVIALNGESGFGKSSLILKLADRFKNIRWKSHFYLYHVDTRSAVSPKFVAEAIRNGFEEAIKNGFLKVENSLSIDSIDAPLSSSSIVNALDYLKKHNKVIVIFFDQFEELFIKDELFHVFENFRKLSFEVDAIQENIVIGCSWRTGIYLPEDHPAYHMWHELTERRKTFIINKFDSGEISQQLQQLSKYSGETLENQLKRRLKEQCFGFPWLLKKLCIHIFRQISKGMKQSELIKTQFNIKQLFDEDTVDLNTTQMNCLKYIAQNSPVGVIELNERFDVDTINTLYQRRLIIRTGYRYAIYWDIFRDYIGENKLPIIPLTIVPTQNVGVIIKAVQGFETGTPFTKEQLAKKLQISENTATNVISDLITFMLIKKYEDDNYRILEEINIQTIEDIRSYFYQQFRHHKIIQEILEKNGDGSIISIDLFRSYVAESYSPLGLNSNSVNAYSAKLLQWFTFCGLMDQAIDGIMIYKNGMGLQKGTYGSRVGRSHGKQTHFFLCSSSPQIVANLISCVIQHKKISHDWVLSHKYRNAAYDACGLNFLQWDGNFLSVSDQYKEKFNELVTDNEIILYIKDETEKTLFIQKLILLRNTDKTLTQIGDEISLSIGRKWTESSKNRYIKSGYKWIADLEILKQ